MGLAIVMGVAGLAAGLGQAKMLRRATEGGQGPAGALARLGLVAAVLVGAAWLGHLLVAAAGWAVGFATAGVHEYRRLR